MVDQDRCKNIFEDMKGLLIFGINYQIEKDFEGVSKYNNFTVFLPFTRSG